MVTTPPPSDPLKVYFANNTPHVVGNTVTVQVHTNKPASATCRLGQVATMLCKQFLYFMYTDTIVRVSFRRGGALVWLPPTLTPCGASFLASHFAILVCVKMCEIFCGHYEMFPLHRLSWEHHCVSERPFRFLLLACDCNFGSRGKGSNLEGVCP